MKVNVFVFTLLLTVTFTACTITGGSEPVDTADPLLANTDPKPLDITTEDQVTLKATYYPVTNSPTPALLLVHMANSNREAWQSFATAAQKNGYAVLAIDLRGHGESSGSASHFQDMSKDIEASLAWLANRPEIAADRIGLVGASLGANLALNAAGNTPNIKSLVLLSPGLDYSGITTTDALARYDQRPVMFVAAENDNYTADSARTLNSRALGQHQLQIYPGKDHGTSLLDAQAGLTPMLLAWFQSTL